MENAYRHFAARVAADAAHAARAAEPCPERQAFAFLEGEWDGGGQVAAFAVTPYGISVSRRGGPAVPFLIYDPASEMWILVSAEPSAYGMLAGLGMRGRKAVFTGEMTFQGVTMRLRQTWFRESEGIVRLRNEEHLGGIWLSVDGECYRRLNA